MTRVVRSVAVAVALIFSAFISCLGMEHVWEAIAVATAVALAIYIFSRRRH